MLAPPVGRIEFDIAKYMTIGFLPRAATKFILPSHFFLLLLKHNPLVR
jgi:hypothetical protein